MMQKVLTTMQDGIQQGVNEVNESIDDALSIDPEEELYKEASIEAEKEESRVDEANRKIDGKLETTRDRVDAINKSFDNGAREAKDTMRKVQQSDIMTAYRCARLYQWGNKAVSYIQDHPDWANSLRDKLMGKSAATRFQELGLGEAVDEETEQICARRNAMFGAPDAGIAPDIMPNTEMILNGAAVPVIEAGLEMAL